MGSAIHETLLLRRFLTLATLQLLLLDVQLAQAASTPQSRREVRRSIAEPGWQWMSRMPEMDGKEFGQAAAPMLQMCMNVETLANQSATSTTPIPGWALSSRMAPLLVLAPEEPARLLAMVYEEIDAGEHPRAVVAFRGHVPVAGALEQCATEFFGVTLKHTSDPFINATLVFMCLTAYNSVSVDYYSQALAYTREALQHYGPSSVLLTGDSMGAILALLSTAAVWTHAGTGLPAMVFLDPGPRRGMRMRDLFLQGYTNGTIISICNEWDPVARLNWDNHVGSLCLVPPPASQELPSSCIRCFAAAEKEENDEYDCITCQQLYHNPFLLLEGFKEGKDPRCYSMGYGSSNYSTIYGGSSTL